MRGVHFLFALLSLNFSVVISIWRSTHSPIRHTSPLAHHPYEPIDKLPTRPRRQELILISGCTGTGKSTFGMECAISKNILKCISTDTIRQVKRSSSDDPALHRSSYAGDEDAVRQWYETCAVLEDGIYSVVKDASNRGISLVLEGVHIVPGSNLIDVWQRQGGIALGIVLYIPDAELHREVILKRGKETGKGASEQIKNFHRIRDIHDEMYRLGKKHNWMIIEQYPSLRPRPIDLVHEKLIEMWKDK